MQMSLTHYWMLVDKMARMSLKADASRYFLGYFWWLFEPLLYVVIFYVVFAIILQTRGDDFLVFLMCGKLTFVWFSKSVTHASQSIIAGRGLIGKIDLPKSLFPLAVIHEGLYKQALVFVLLFGFVALAGYAPVWQWLWLLPIVIVNYLLIVACGIAGAILVCLFFDFTVIIQLGMMMLLFVSGIFWDPRGLPSDATTELVLAVNPVAFVIDAYRQVLMVGVSPDVAHLTFIGLVSGALIFVLLVVTKRYSQFFALKAITT